VRSGQRAVRRAVLLPTTHCALRTILRTAHCALLTFFLACTRAPAPHPPRVIFVGLDGADWQMLDQYALPNLASLARAGDKRVLLTQHPPLSPLVWTTMMTGVSPLEHRVLDFTRFDPVTRVREPITSDERAVPAIWNMVSARGKKVGVFGLWATDPPESVNGIIVSDRMIRDSSPDLWQRTLNETETTHRIAREWIAKNRSDLAIVYFEGTDIAGHLFAQRDSDEPKRYFARIDQILGDYRVLAKELDATLVIASDHGFDWFTKRRPETSTAMATAAKWHRDEGILLVFRPLSPPQRGEGGRKPGEGPRDTTSSAFGTFSPARGGEGPPLPTRVDGICSMLLEMLKLPRDVREYRRGWHRAAPKSTEASNEEIKKLTALGYIGAGEGAGAPLSDEPTRTSGSFNNEGVILREQRQDDEALAAFENALRVDPKSASAMWNLSDLLHHLNRDSRRADALLDEAIALDPNQPRWLLARGRTALQHHDCKSALTDFKRATDLNPDDALAFASLGTAELCLGDNDSAMNALRHSLALDPNQPELSRALRDTRH
jgi:Flp pilus assembly protein TadD